MDSLASPKVACVIGLGAALAGAFGGPVLTAADGGIQWTWDVILHYGSPYVTNPYVAGTITQIVWFLICVYFTVLDLVHADTKVQKDYWPTAREMADVAIPQIIIYSLANGYTWVHWINHPEITVELPEKAPTLIEFTMQLAAALVVGDFFIYWAHRTMHIVPFLRNNIHNVHHEYSAPFSWAGGWVHPLEDLVAIACQVIPAYFFCHPLTQWVFAMLWTVLLIDEHSGHDVWWSPYRWLVLTGKPLGGGAGPHDIHHFTPTKNFGFVFCFWDQIFGTYLEPSEYNVNPYEPPYVKTYRSKERISEVLALQKEAAVKAAGVKNSQALCEEEAEPMQ